MKTTETTAIPSTATVSKTNAIILAACCFGFAVILATFTLLATSNALAKPAPQSPANSDSRTLDQPVELGDVHWKRDLNEAVADSKKENKPIAILFQEVPG